MTKYLYIYKAETSQVPSTPEEGEKAMAAWGAWMEKVGPKMVDPGNPVGKSWTVDARGAREGGNALPIMGYSIVECESIEEACALAEGNPMIAGGGEVEVTPIVPIEM
ncbi:MAG: hypothetical protein GYB53_11895 [Rhodobacteraceae bacterium]|nr:hypothetical protein [Paracoccaceae bacterium]MBR9821421.1 hypothetical protein [Paracoccaceae bacterium]